MGEFTLVDLANRVMSVACCAAFQALAAACSYEKLIVCAGTPMYQVYTLNSR